MGVQFISRRTKRDLPASDFYLYNGPEMYDPEHWHVGDNVSVLFRLAANEIDLLNDSLPQNSPLGFKDLSTVSGSVHIRCAVVSRSHVVNWAEVGRLQMLSGTSLKLEAESQKQEDVLIWILSGKKPKWFKRPVSKGAGE